MGVHISPAKHILGVCILGREIKGIFQEATAHVPKFINWFPYAGVGSPTEGMELGDEPLTSLFSCLQSRKLLTQK